MDARKTSFGASGMDHKDDDFDERSSVHRRCKALNRIIPLVRIILGKDSEQERGATMNETQQIWRDIRATEATKIVVQRRTTAGIREVAPTKQYIIMITKALRTFKSYRKQ